MGRYTAVIFKPSLRYHFSSGAYNTIFCAERAPTSFFCCAWACSCCGPRTLSCAAARVRCKTTAAFVQISPTTLWAPRRPPLRSKTIYLACCRTSMKISTSSGVCGQCRTTSLPQGMSPNIRDLKIRGRLRQRKSR